MEENLKSILPQLDELLQSVDKSKVTSNGPGFEDLPDGYYLSEVGEKTKLTVSNSSGFPMVSLHLKTIEDGCILTTSDSGDISYSSAPKTKGRAIFIHYVLKDVQSVKRMISDMLKFELPENPGEPMLGKEFFESHDLLIEALECIKTSRIWVNVQSFKKPDGTRNTNANLINWNRVAQLELPL